MPEGQLDKLADLCQLLAHASNVVVSNVVEALLVLALDRLALTKDHCVRSNDAIVSWIRLHDLELNRPHSTADKEKVVLANGAVGLEEVRLQEGLEKVSGHTLDGVIDGEHVDSLAVLDIRAGVHMHNVSQSHSEIVTHNLVHPNLRFLDRVVGQHDANSVLALLALQAHCVSTEKLQFLHRIEVKRDDAVVIIDRVINHQAVGVFLLENLRFGFRSGSHVCEVSLKSIRAGGAE
mmetsp:Transcript_57639/g.86952  ORF Transcript_57639/g.86952 Transcript_57639/m.86952 type:complete len:235 (+) Transcript_57639:1972-2676(+)